MFLDASVVFAILNMEPGFEELLKRLKASPTPILYSPLSRFEVVVSLARYRAGMHRSATPAEIGTVTRTVDQFLVEVGAKCAAITDAIGTGALTAAQTYGRCVDHPAGLNLGDCFAYACAKGAGVGLLYKGEDFAMTDLG